MRHVCLLIAFAAGAATVGATTAPAVEGELPLEYYANLPAVPFMALSPSGRQLAAIANIDGRAVVVTKPTGADKYVSILHNDNERFVINWMRWASDDHLLVSLRYADKRNGVATIETRLISVAVDGSAIQSMVDYGGRNRPTWVPQFQDRIVDVSRITGFSSFARWRRSWPRISPPLTDSCKLGGYRRLPARNCRIAAAMIAPNPSSAQAGISMPSTGTLSAQSPVPWVMAISTSLRGNASSM